MKKILKLALSILAISVVIYSCTQEESLGSNSENLDNLEVLSQKSTLNESTKQVSNLFFNLGVSAIEVTKKDNKMLLSLTSEKTFKFNNNSINLSDYSVSIDEKLITLKEDVRFKIGLIDNKAFIISPNYIGFYDKADLEIKKNIKTFVLVSFLNELLYDKEKISVSENADYVKKGGCSFLDQGFSVGVGVNSTSAQADLQASMEDDIASGATAGCRKIGEPEAVAFTGGTVWVQTWCCS
ncbi:MAG: hypothetical protein AUK46_05280 [Flavobacteriaceae bacterium CG2_30_31_66]|nr:MAG: hypothetical protein AUK46_05280 [Flavobacteriaceae bacterium CG2_30_31_66]